MSRKVVETTLYQTEHYPWSVNGSKLSVPPSPGLPSWQVFYCPLPGVMLEACPNHLKNEGNGSSEVNLKPEGPTHPAMQD